MDARSASPCERILDLRRKGRHNAIGAAVNVQAPIAKEFDRRLAKAPTPSPVLVHAFGTMTAALLALWLAYQLELDTPYSAVTTVVIVSNPVHGMILSKSLYRLGGTLVGAVVAVTLMASFGQAPELFMLGLSLWMGLCTALSTLLHNFRSYAAVLAGYTVALIALPGVDHPDSIFDLAMARVAVVSLGIVCSALVASILTQHSGARRLEQRLRVVLTGICACCRLTFSGGDERHSTQLRRSLAPQIGELDALVTFAAAETPEIGLLAEALQGAAAAMFSTLTAVAALQDALATGAQQRILIDMLAEATVVVDSVTAALAQDDLAPLDRASAALAELRGCIENAFDPADLSLLTMLDRLDDVLDELALCLEGLTNLLGRRRGSRFVAVRRHLDWRWAGVNGARATIAIWLAGAIWYLSAWPYGGSMVAAAVPIVGLLSLRDSPTADAIGFVWGTSLALIVGFFYLIWVFPQISDFPLLALWLAPILALGAAAMTLPKYAFVATGFTVFFITLLAPSNPLQYNPELFLNNAFATIGGAVLTALVYRLVLPVDAKQLKRFLIADIQRDLQGLLRTTKPVQRAAWESRMHQRLLLLGARLRAAGVNADTSLRAGFAALRLGREVLRLRELLTMAREPLTEAKIRAIAEPAIAGFAISSIASQASVHSCRIAADQLMALALESPTTEAAVLARTAAAFVEIAMLAGRQRRVFQSFSRP